MNRLIKIIVLTGLFVGTTDILAAIIGRYIDTGEFPEKMFHYIAGGLIGLDRSMDGGNWIALLGLFNHYGVAMAYTVLFFLLLPRLKFLQFNRYLVGMLYAVFVSLSMKFIVLPITPLPPGGDIVLIHSFKGWIVLGVVLGIPIAYNAYRYYKIQDRLFS